MGVGYDSYIDLACKAPMPDGKADDEREPCPHDTEDIEWNGEPPAEFPVRIGRVLEGECMCGARVLGHELPGGTIVDVEAVE